MKMEMGIDVFLTYATAAAASFFLSFFLLILDGYARTFIYDDDFSFDF